MRWSTLDAQLYKAKATKQSICLSHDLCRVSSGAWRSPGVPVRLAVEEAREVRARTRRDPEVLVDRPRNAGVLRPAAARRLAQVDHVGARAIGVPVGRHRVGVDDPAGRTVLAHLDGGKAGAPRRLPEVPPLVAERDADADAVVDAVLLAGVAGDDAEGDRAGHGIVATALLHREPVVVRRRVAE